MSKNGENGNKDVCISLLENQVTFMKFSRAELLLYSLLYRLIDLSIEAW